MCDGGKRGIFLSLLLMRGLRYKGIYMPAMFWSIQVQYTVVMMVASLGKNGIGSITVAVIEPRERRVFFLS